MASIFGVASKKGLIDAIADERLQLSDVLIGTDVEGLYIIPAGHQHALSAELFSSELRTGMEEKESQLRTQMGLALDRGAPRALKGGGSETLSGARTPSAPTARSSTTPSLEDTD